MIFHVPSKASFAVFFLNRSALDQKEGNSFSNVKHGSPNTQVPEFSEHQQVTARYGSWVSIYARIPDIWWIMGDLR